MIRDARSTDAAGIAAIWNPVIRDTAITFNSAEKTEAEIAKMIAERQAAGHGTWVAEEFGKILGFVTVSQFRGGVGYAHTLEHTVILAPGQSGRGIGRALMSEMENHSREQKAHSVFAGVSGENPAGAAFHEAIGYRLVSILPEVGYKFGRWMDLHLMQKIL